MPTKWTQIKINYHYLDTIYQISVSKEEKQQDVGHDTHSMWDKACLLYTSRLY